MTFTFNLPCKYYVAHYLKHRFGNPVSFPYGSEVGKYFYSLVEDAKERFDWAYKPYASSITIQITESVFLRKGCVLTKTNITAFNNFIEADFKKQINLILDTQIEINEVSIKEAIDFVYDKFDMDETIFPMETIIKQYYRDRKARNGLIFNK